MGPAPQGATKRNFYLPITAVYGRWCQQICDMTQKPPAVFQCTWLERPNQASKFFLGASLSGYRSNTIQTGTWQYIMNRARFYLINQEPLKLAGWSFKNSPQIRRNGKQSTKFGRCAETYPFRVLLKYVDFFFFFSFL
jgi:hypothetical protein